MSLGHRFFSAAHGLLSLISLLRAFLLNVIKRNLEGCMTAMQTAPDVVVVSGREGCMTAMQTVPAVCFVAPALLFAVVV